MTTLEDRLRAMNVPEDRIKAGLAQRARMTGPDEETASQKELREALGLNQTDED
jgi:hypothetical protein